MNFSVLNEAPSDMASVVLTPAYADPLTDADLKF